MRRRTAIRAAIMILACAALLSGCAGTARGKKTSIYRHDQAVSAVDLSRSNADAMVTIRFPAVVEEEALTAYYTAFEEHAIGGEYERNTYLRQDTARIAQSIVTKSNYFSMSLYRELRDKLPPHSVLLSPHVIELDDEKRLTSRPLLASEQIPSVITIDFNVYSHPDPRKMMNSPPLTFGDIITPLFVIHSNRWLRPPTYGLLLSSKPLVGAAWSQSSLQARKQMAARLHDVNFEFQRPLDYVALLAGHATSASDLPLKSASQERREWAAVEVHPLEKIQMDGEPMATLTSDPEIDPFAEDFVKGAATRIVAALNNADHDRATFFARQIALARFDPALGEAFLSRSRSEDLRARLQMGEALIEAERKFLSKQSESLYIGAYEGVYGSQMRQMIAAEYRLLEDRRDLARAQNLSTALAVVAMAGAIYAGSNGDSSNILHSNTMENLLLLSSMWAVNTAMAKNAQSKTVSENFLAQIAPAINRQVSVQVEWLQSREEITARDFTEFRGKTLGLYQGSVRSVSAHVFDPQCEFRHPALDTPGRWFGLCRDGLGISSGYGLIIDEEQHYVEFVGTAEQGLAAGTGAMIFDAPGRTGATWYEGQFSQGLPDGVVRVQRPGGKPRIRRFKAGSDAGVADADSLQLLQF